jgi:hypothetical protein
MGRETQVVDPEDEACEVWGKRVWSTVTRC